MTQYVFILSDHDEHGAENVCATLDRGRLCAMVDENWPLEGHRPSRVEAKTRLIELLRETDRELAARCSDGGVILQYGWGGIQLHVVALR